MDKLGLSEIIRYSATGFVVLAIAYICEPVAVKAIISELGTLGLPVGAFVLGCLVFFIYRLTIYELLLLRVVDFLHGANNVRDFLMRRYAIERAEAETLWTFVKRAKLEKQFERIDLESSGVHFLYLTGVFSLAGAAYLLSWKQYPVFGINKPSALLALSSVVFAAALLNDLRIERLEAKLLSTISLHKVDEVAERLEYHCCDSPGEAR